MDYRFGYIFDENQDKVLSIENVKNIIHASEVDVRKKLLNLKNMNAIELQKNNMVLFHRITPKKWSLMISNSMEMPVYSIAQRIAIIYLTCYMEQELTSVYLFEFLLDVSKGTVLSDIKKLRRFVGNYKIILNYSRKEGFTLKGGEQTIRKVAHDFIVQLMEEKSGRYALFFLMSSNDIELYSRTRDIVSSSIKRADLSVVDGRLNEVIFFVGCSTKRIGTKPVYDFCLSPLIKSIETLKSGIYVCNILTNEITENSEIEYEYMSEVIMTAIKGDPKDQSLDIFFKYSADIIRHMEALAAIEFSNYSNLLINLFRHLVPAYFRMNLNFKIANSITADVRKQYREIFNMTKMSLESFEKFINRTVPNEELSYIAILFGGAIYKEKIKRKNLKPRAIVLCPDGASLAILLKSELKEMFPNMRFKLVEGINEFFVENSRSTYDVIFSTTNIEMKQKNIFMVTPIMSPFEKNALMTRVQNKIILPGAKILPAGEIIKTLKPYMDLKKDVTEQDVYIAINNKINKNIRIEEDDRPMLKDLLSPDMIQLNNGDMNWKDSIRVAAKPLLDKAAIEPKYIDAMINKVKKYGPFINIGEGIALPHARPEEGANKIGISVMKTEKPVLILDEEEHPVQLFICLSAVDSSTHLKALAELTEIISDKGKVQNILKANTKEDVLNILIDR
jgi:PTS system ascorbate-specific IIA component